MKKKTPIPVHIYQIYFTLHINVDIGLKNPVWGVIVRLSHLMRNVGQKRYM